MKKKYPVFKNVLSFVLLIFSLASSTSLLFSCSNTPASSFSNELSVGSPALIYNDYVYYYSPNHQTIVYQNLSNTTETAIPLVNDPLIESDKNPLYCLTSETIFLLDHINTPLNDGYPIFIIVKKDIPTSPDPTPYEIISFNTKNNSVDIIKDDIYDNVQSLHFHNNVIYYTTNCGNEGFDMHQLHLSGKNYIKKENENKLMYRIHSVYNDKIYYSIDGIDKLYSCNLDFSNDSYICDAVLTGDFFVLNDYIYYYYNLVQEKYNNSPVFSVDLMRKSISEPSDPEIVVSNIYGGRSCGNKYYYYKCAPRLINENMIDNGTDKMYVFDLDSGENTIFYDYTDNSSIINCSAVSPQWLLFSEYDFSNQANGNGSTSTYIQFVINVNTKNKVILP